MIAQVCAMYGYPIHYVTSEIAIWDFYALHLYGTEMREIDAAAYAFENCLELFGYPKQEKNKLKGKSNAMKDALTSDSIGVKEYTTNDLKFV